MKWRTIILSIFILAVVSSLGLGITFASNVTNSSDNIQILDKKVHGNVMKNPAIKKYMVKTTANKKMVSKLKQGSVVYRLGNGKGKKILICGGIHGNEPQGPLAVTKFLNYLKKKKINGTIYIIPFAIPIDTQKNSRKYVLSNGYDPNRKANVIGTPVNKILKFAISHKVDYLIDVHSGTGVSSKGLVYYQKKNEKKWAKYIQKKTGAVISTKPQRGTFRTESSRKGIQSLTFEVNKGSSIIKTSNKEFKMLKYACAYLHMIKI